jgi:hypothetical protein
MALPHPVPSGRINVIDALAILDRNRFEGHETGENCSRSLHLHGLWPYIGQTDPALASAVDKALLVKVVCLRQQSLTFDAQPLHHVLIAAVAGGPPRAGPSAPVAALLLPWDAAAVPDGRR